MDHPDEGYKGYWFVDIPGNAAASFRERMTLKGLGFYPANTSEGFRTNTFEVRAVCSPDIADGHHRLEYPPAEFRRFVGNRIKTLESLSNPEVQTVRDACLAALQGIFIDHAKQKHGSH